ncbi:Gfo/Idh/MocA family protein [Paenibacillus sacheonensis]|uniref:Gfo/Idh/MocA family oxidoreductase n=1 Tax=Paenibacillus sacheonensis TaxID=742054 RepID=A0A7X4YMU8_9BACL|nr:Gfo/Idh/MocA family oxidoreductase [Paenibacillus sacheonensis]MBM7564738.1 putative dehydrogenase [Paenibacillus sacheonensis]NBC69293.1 Gfo/Idh/MocA family oxidoreductase [Paenibacillus sacheonensis]
MNTIKVGIVGTGFSASFHLEALRRLPYVEVAAIAGSTLAKAQEAAHKYGIPRAYGTPEELIADGDVQVVHNCTPNHLHFEINEAVLLAGKHLLSEKPLAMNAEQSARLAELAKRHGAVSGVCFNYRHYPLVAETRRRIQNGQTGPVHLITGGYLQDWLLEETDYNWRLHTDLSGETRAIADIGSHWCDLAQHLTGQRIVEVFADLKTLYPTRKKRLPGLGPDGKPQYEDIAISTEDFGSVLVHFEGGTHGVFTVSQVSAGRKNKLFIDLSAEKESLHWDQELANKLWIGQRGTASRVVGCDPGELSEEAAAMVHYPGGHEEGWPDGVKNLFIDFYQAIRNNEDGRKAGQATTFASIEEGHYMMRIHDAIVESCRNKSWVRV